MRVIHFANESNIDMSLSYKDFIENYRWQNLRQYEESYYSAMLPDNGKKMQSSSSSGGKKYYYDTGVDCPAEASYSKYNLLDTVKKGDVIFEATGGGGITGHIAIVEGIFTRSNGSSYIRIIEAIDVGVKRGILDDTRFDEKKVTVLRVSRASETTKSNAVDFCIGELDSSYVLDFAKDTSADETDWYCSELVWAAYMNQDINIEVGGLHGEPGVTPRDILDSSRTFAVTVSER